MTAAVGATRIAVVRDRVRTRLVGREHELDLLLAAVAAGRDIVLEGPPGTSKSTLLRQGSPPMGHPAGVRGGQRQPDPGQAGRDARVLLLSDCVHNAARSAPVRGPAARLDVLLDTSGEQDADLARDLARLGHGRMLLARTYRDIAPALATLFTGLAGPRPRKEEQCPSSSLPPSRRGPSTGTR